MTWQVVPFWEALAQRCEECSSIDRELDAEIALAIFGGEIEWQIANYTMETYPTRKYVSNMHTRGFGHCAVERFTSSIDDACYCIPAGGAYGRWKFYMTNAAYLDGVYQEEKAYARTDSPLSSGGGPYFIGLANTMAGAICAAGLRARGFMASLEQAQAAQPPKSTEDQQG
jgi:hypothetical protein